MDNVTLQKYIEDRKPAVVKLHLGCGGVAPLAEG